MKVEDCLRMLEHLQGSILGGVAYRDLRIGADPEPMSWDLGDLHQPTMGVEADFAGRPVSFIWDRLGDDYGIQVFAGELTETVSPETVHWDVSEHPSWRPFVGRPLEEAAVWLFRENDTPAAIELVTADGTAWIMAADIHDGLPALGMDDMVVVFDADIAHRTLAQELIRRT